MSTPTVERILVTLKGIVVDSDRNHSVFQVLSSSEATEMPAHEFEEILVALKTTRSITSFRFQVALKATVA